MKIKALAADNENDETAVDTINGVYRGGLDNLKKKMQGGG